MPTKPQYTDHTNFVTIDPSTASLAGEAAEQAYTDYIKSDDANYTPKNLQHGTDYYSFVERFTGFDAVAWGSGVEERFGLVYQSKADESAYLIAFRGTSSVYDMWEDLDSVATTPFRPHHKTAKLTDGVRVGAGFNRIYASKSLSMANSMQAQLFDLIDKLPTPPKSLLITGHSLGSALCSLFTLDLAIGRADIDVQNINFASPRVGTQEWQTCYNEAFNLQEKTVRVCNNYDLIPQVPFDFAPMDFRHIGNEFSVSFTLDSYMHDPVIIIEAWHSLNNYRYVTDRAAMRSPEVWAGDFHDQADTHTLWPMTSYDPDKKTLNWAEGELMKVRKDLEEIAAYM